MSARKSTYIFEYRITFLGGEKVGKSALIHQFTNNDFIEDYSPTTEDHLTHVCQHDGNMCVCLFVDTSGSNDFPAMRKLSVAKGNAFVVVYGIDDRKSFERAKIFIDEIKEIKGKEAEVKIVLVGNKTDNEGGREVDYSEGLSYAANLHEGNVIPKFLETSAKDYDSIKCVINNLLSLFSPPPSQVDVPVLNDKPTFFERRLSLRRRSKRSTKERTKSSEIDIEEQNKENRNSFSDSEIFTTTPVATSPKTNDKRIRMRSGSQPILKTPYEDNGNSFSLNNILPLYFRKASHCEVISEISTPTLISSSSSISRYNLRKTRSISVTSNCSDDSGVSGDCNTPERSPSNSPKLSQKRLMRRASLPVPRPQLNIRRPSLTEKMQKMFKRSRSGSQLHSD